MPRRKPAGWPDLMTAKRLASGAIGYYWAPPTRAKRSGCPVLQEALGTDYAIAKRRCDEVLNPHYKAWLTHGEADLSVPRAATGTWDWMVGVYKQSPKYTRNGTETRSSYDRMLAMVSKYVLKDGRLFGTLALASITPGTADSRAILLDAGFDDDAIDNSSAPASFAPRYARPDPPETMRHER